MTPTARFCTHCGAALAANARFCAKCGTPVKQPGAQHVAPPPPPANSTPLPPPPPQFAAPPPQAQQASPPTVGSESILSLVLGLQRQKGLLGMGIDNYSLIITPTRLIFAHLDNRTMQTYVQRARVEAKAEGKGFFGQWGAQLAWLSLLERDLQSVSPDQLLAQNSKSFSLPNSSISRIRFRRKTSTETDTTTHIVLLIDTTSGKYKFQIPATFRITQRELKQRLSQTLGAVVK